METNPTEEDLLKEMGLRDSLTMMVEFETEVLSIDLVEQAYVELEKVIGDLTGVKPDIDRSKSEVVYLHTDKSHAVGVHTCVALIEYYHEGEGNPGGNASKIGVKDAL